MHPKQQLGVFIEGKVSHKYQNLSTAIKQYIRDSQRIVLYKLKSIYNNKFKPSNIKIHTAQLVIINFTFLKSYFKAYL